MYGSTRSIVIRYLLPLALVIVVFAITLETPLRGDNPYLLAITAILISTWIGGLISGLVATALSLTGVLYFLAAPAGPLDLSSVGEISRLLVFVFVALLLSSLIAARERAQAAERSRASQQAAVAELGLRALASNDLAGLLQYTADLVSETLHVEYCKVLELLPGEEKLLLKAGHGWHAGLVGQAIINAGLHSHAGYALRCKEPVIVRDLSNETRFNGEPLLIDHHVVSGMSVIIHGKSRPFGVLGAHTSEDRVFTQDDINFLQAVANVIATAVDREAREAALDRSQHRFQALFNGAMDAILFADDDGRYLDVNPAAAELTGYSRGELAGMHVWDITPKASRETGRGMWAEFLAAGQSEGDYVIRRKDGSEIIAEFRAVANVTPGLHFSVLHDITERKRVEQEALRMAAIIQSSDDAILSKTIEGTILTWNPAAERLYGYSAQEITGKSVTLLYPPERIQEFYDIRDRLKRGEGFEHHDAIRIRKDGKPVDVSISISPVKDSKGRVIGAATVARDIRARKQAEDALRFLAQAGDVLASSLDYETTLRSLARLAVPKIADWCAVDVLAEDGSVKRLALAHVDPAKVEMAYELERHYPQDPKAPRGVHEVIRTGKPELALEVRDKMLEEAAHDAEHLRLLRQLEPRSYMSVPLLARGRILGAITFIAAESGRHYGPSDLDLAQDLARRAALAVDNARLYRESQVLNEELEQRVVSRTIALRKANRKLEEEAVDRMRVNEQLRQLSAHLQSAREEERIRVAREIHDEMGQILTAIKMDLSLLSRRIQGGEALGADAIAGELDSTASLVDNSIHIMHEIIRELRPEILDHLGLKAAIEWQLQDFARRTQIETQLDAPSEEVSCDLERSTAVFRIFQETLNNVARHANATRVDAAIREENGALILQVKDDGKGMPPEAWNGPNSFGILGMRERAHMFGGDVEISSVPGQGTQVTVRFPQDITSLVPASLQDS